MPRDEVPFIDLIEVARIVGNNFDIVTYKDDFGNTYLKREYKESEGEDFPGSPTRFNT